MASTDPDGDELIYTIDNAGPYGIGPTTVVVTVDVVDATVVGEACRDNMIFVHAVDSDIAVTDVNVVVFVCHHH